MTANLSEIDLSLVTRAAGGDSRAVADIVQALQAPVYGIALRMLLVKAEAEDATQEALIRIVTRLAQFRGESAFSTWAYRIAVRRILDYRGQTAARLSFEAFGEDLDEGLDEDATESPEDAIYHHQLKLTCGRAMLQCLDSDHRIAFVLGGILEISSETSAEILEIEPATFRKRLSRARAALGNFLHRKCGVFDEANACRCHKRLGRALSLGRVNKDDIEITEGTLIQLRKHIATISELQRVTAFYRDEPRLESKRDFVAEVRSLINHPESP